MKLIETVSRTIETETGTATLNLNGSMTLDNSGYIQVLSPEQVAAAWNGASKLPLSSEVRAELEAEGISPEMMEHSRPFYDGEYWDFGDEQHVIPPKNMFDQ